jgi:threonine synthase
MPILDQPDELAWRLHRDGIMKFVSTRGGKSVDLDTALVQGIASDGGLFLPDVLPNLSVEALSNESSEHALAKIFLTSFFEGSRLASELDEIIAETFFFEIPKTQLPVENGRCDLLELFHGPTAAFKDVGAKFLAACLSRLEGDDARPLTILVATSGDTGGAVAAAFNKRPGMRVVVLYPDGMVSNRQAHQLTCWSDNVLSLAVNGTFDYCQTIVKTALADASLSAKHRFSSANSINIGRLLPQAVYYANASIAHWKETGNKPGFIIPTGNLGNAFSCFLAREVGLPIGDIVLVTNANRIINDYLGGAEWAPRTSVQTLASAMDVGNPSNMERLRFVGGEAKELAKKVKSLSVTDEEITQQIAQNYQDWNIATCPHTATATFAWRNLSAPARIEQDWILVATAHAAKFEQIVEPIIGSTVEPPPELAEILEKPSRVEKIDASMSAFEQVLERRFG